MVPISKVEEYRIGFIGFGHMAQTICRGLMRSRLIAPSHLLFHRRDPKKAKENEREFQISSTSLRFLVEQSDLLLLCTRPDQAGIVLSDLAPMEMQSKKIVSILAGVSLSYFEHLLPPHCFVARAMPNLGSGIGEGMTLLSFGSLWDLESKSLVHLVFGALGSVADIPETQMDVGCAIAGSGIAFVAHLIEEMVSEACREGMEYKTALLAVSQTFIGAAKLIEQGLDPNTLLNQITTKGGTTQAGLKALQESKGESVLTAAVRAAALRSKEIGKQFT